MDHLHLLGTPAFIPTLLTQVHARLNALPLSSASSSAAAAAAQIDTPILHSLLLCLVARRNLILRTSSSEGGKEEVGRVAGVVHSALINVFGMGVPSTNATRVRLRARGKEKLDTKELFERLFSVAAPLRQPDPSTSYHLLQRNRKISASSRSRSIPTLPSSLPPSFSVSLPEAIAFQRSLPESYALADAGGIMIQRPRPVYPHERVKLHHADTDPFPLSVKTRGVEKDEDREKEKETGKEVGKDNHKGREREKEKEEEKERNIPQAIVVSGLHHASTSAQLALSSALREGEIEMDGESVPLPRDFILIYICAGSLTERPGLHPSLIDKFGMSTNVKVSSAMPSSPSSPHQPFKSLSKPAPHSHSHPSSHPIPSSSSLQPLLPPTFISHLHTSLSSTSLSPSIQLYLQDLFTAARHHPLLFGGELLSVRAREDAEVLVRAQRILGVDLFGGEAVRNTSGGGGGRADRNRLSKMSAFTNDSEWEEEWEMEMEMEHDEDDDEGKKDGKRKERKGKAKGKPRPLPLLDVSEIDVARIFPRVVSHRLGLREAPEDEVVSSVVFPACFSGGGGGTGGLGGLGGEAKESVKDVLVGILGEV